MIRPFIVSRVAFAIFRNGDTVKGLVIRIVEVVRNIRYNRAGFREAGGRWLDAVPNALNEVSIKDTWGLAAFGYTFRLQRDQLSLRGR